MDADNAVAQTAAVPQDRLPVPPPEYILFYRENYRRMTAYVMHIGASDQEADEVTSKTLVQLLPRWDAVEDPIAWVRRGLLSNLISLRTSERRRRAREAQYVAASYEPSVDPADVWDNPTAVNELLGILTENQRTVVRELMRGLSQAETAELLGRSYDAVRRSLTEIRQRLERHRPELTPRPRMSTTSTSRKEAR